MARPILLILNGPNLNLLGTREPEVYGRATLADIEASCRARADALGLDIEFRQSNSEGQLIDWIQEARGRKAAIVINPAGLSHSSVSLMDALAAVALPVVEVHLSNIHRREEFRQHSFVSRVAVGVIAGLGAQGYELAVEAAARLVKREA
ncbi:MAG TPA: type II 3-dehydroquinate dehydratase [Stellaceae bacterium]|nr:type II 3-dehydroquinate dehydratase [Stellaceae bacterium]